MRLVLFALPHAVPLEMLPVGQPLQNLAPVSCQKFLPRARAILEYLDLFLLGHALAINVLLHAPLILPPPSKPRALQHRTRRLPCNYRPHTSRLQIVIDLSLLRSLVGLDGGRPFVRLVRTALGDPLIISAFGFLCFGFLPFPLRAHFGHRTQTSMVVEQRAGFVCARPRTYTSTGKGHVHT